MIVIAFALGLSTRTGQAVLDEVAAKLKKVNALSVTLTTHYPGNGRTTIERFWVLKGGHMRYEQENSEILLSPASAWVIWPIKKTYKRTAVPPKGSPRNPFSGMPGLFGENDLKAIGDSGEGNWYGQPSIGVLMDARKMLAPKAKLVYYFARTTKLPLGFQVQQGNFKAEGVYSGLKVDPQLTPKDFLFQPGKGWKVETIKK